MSASRRSLVVFVILAALLALLSGVSVSAAAANGAGGSADAVGPSAAGAKDGVAGQRGLLEPAVVAGVTPIPPGPTTSLPDYGGAPAHAQGLGSSGVPQNPLLAPNGFNSCHLDPWMSDTANVAGPLGIEPTTLSSTFASARQVPTDTTDGPPWVFVCITPMFDSHGRLLTACFAPHEATAVLADPDTLAILSDYHLATPSGNVYGATGRQAVMRSTGGSYSFLDAQDRLTIVSGGKQIVALVEAGTAEKPVLQVEHTYDLTSLIPEDYNDVAGVMLDWQGRIWFTTAASANTVAKVGLINPATWSDAAPSVKWFAMPSGELIRNTFAVTKSGEDRASAYVVTSTKMYRIDAGGDDQPYLVWSSVPYDTIGTTKNGQYELGSGTSPTLLGDGNYVAITDNADPMKVVVYRTGETVDAAQRVVCQVPLFLDQPGQALSNSLIGFQNSLIASNNYNYLWDWQKGQTIYPSAPGFARIDINADGQGCTTVWSQTDVATTVSPRLSTVTGLIYTVAREYDPNALNTGGTQGVYVYYWIAINFRTGQTVWKKMAGTGDQFDSFYPALAMGPNGGLYVGAFGGFMMMKDTLHLWCPVARKQ